MLEDFPVSRLQTAPKGDNKPVTLQLESLTPFNALSYFEPMSTVVPMAKFISNMIGPLSVTPRESAAFGDYLDSIKMRSSSADTTDWSHWKYSLFNNNVPNITTLA